MIVPAARSCREPAALNALAKPASTLSGARGSVSIAAANILLVALKD